MAKKATAKSATAAKSKIAAKPAARSSAKSESPKTASDKLVITAALPYANGSIHIGHLLEYIQADIYSRFMKLLPGETVYICASDMHGTPIEVNAAKAGIAPEKFVEKYWKEHQEDFKSFLIKFDNYYKTHSPENKELAEYFFASLKKKNLIYVKIIDVIYCENCQRSLPDRFVRGRCPLCGKEDQYGDVCEGCGSALKGTDLLNPKCSLCGKTPIIKQSKHYFFKLSTFARQLKEWMNSKDADLQLEVKNWLNEWLTKSLEDWCISRDEPYFGFEIPGSLKECGEKKFFYVWLDAPIGYISSTKNYCNKQPGKKQCRWEDYWKKGKVQHFIGKDISYFHFLFWPAMLMAMEIPLPKITVHGFITVDGQKMSKSRGTFFTAKDFLKLYQPEALRFYYASHLDRKVVDIDLSFADFQAYINNVLMGNLGNFCYRTLTFAQKNYGEIKEIAKNEDDSKKILFLIESIKKSYSSQDYKEAVKHILEIADLGNSYFQNSAPWKNKDDAESRKAVGWCVNLTRNLAIIASPILPEFSGKIFAALSEKEEEPKWKNISFGWKGKIRDIEMLVKKVEHLPGANKFPLSMVVGQIKEVKDHPNADTLYLMKVDLGKEIGLKQVVAGLKKYFSKNDLLNRKAVFVVNLKPAKLRGEMSEAMILAADDGARVGLLDVAKTGIGEEVCFLGLENSAKEIAFEEFLKLKMEVIAGEVFYNRKKLASKVESISVKGVKDKAQVR